MDPEQGPSKPTFRRRKWSTAYDTYSDGFTFREELNFEYDSETSSSDSEPECDSAVIDLASEDEEQEEKSDKRGRNVKKRKDRRKWKNLVRNFKSLQKWRIRSMDAIFLHSFDNWHANGFKCSYSRQVQDSNMELGRVEHISDISVVVQNELLPSSSSYSRQPQGANIEVDGAEHVSDISVVIQNELSNNNEAAANFVPLQQEYLASNETTQRDPDFALQTLPPIQEFFAARSSAAIPLPPPYLQNTSTCEIAEIPPSPMQDRSFGNAAGFAVEQLSMTQNTSRSSAAGFAVKPRPPMMQNSFGPRSSTSEVGTVPPSSMQDRSYNISVAEFAMETPSMMQNTFGPRASIPLPPLAPLSPFVQNKSIPEIAAVPPPSTQTSSSTCASAFAVELPSMSPNMYGQRAYVSIPQPSPFLQNTRAPFFIPPPSPFLQNTSTGEFAAEPLSLTQNVFRSGVPGSSETQVPYGIPPPMVPTRPHRIASRPLPLMLNDLPPISYESRPQSSMQQNRFSASRGYDDPRFVNGVPLPLTLPPPLIPITPELYPICDRIAQRQREQRRLQLQNIHQE